MATTITALAGHVSKETAFVVDDYPYGFTLRCKMRYWIETRSGYGQRVMSQTTNPKRAGEVWNTPKASTYSSIRILYRDETTGHIENDGISMYSDLAAIDAFAERYAAALTSERDRKALAYLRTLATRPTGGA